MSLEQFLDPRKVHVYADERMAQWKLGRRFFPPLTLEIILRTPVTTTALVAPIGTGGRTSEKPRLAWRSTTEYLDVSWEGAVKGLYISGGGEPLLAPHVFDYIRRFSKYTKVFLITNGYMLAKEDALHVCEFLDRLQISIHSTDQHQYRQITCVDGLKDFHRFHDSYENMLQDHQRSERCALL